MEPVFYQSGRETYHPLERMLNASAWAILTSIERSRMAVMNVKGQLAEYYLSEYLKKALADRRIESFEWRIASPDFSVKVGNDIVLVECKNVRKPSGKPKDPWWVETQRTRGGRKGGADTRPYKVKDFEVLAVSLFNRTGRWDYWFAASRNLATRPNDRSLLAVRQQMPEQPDNKWHQDILDAIEDVKR